MSDGARQPAPPALEIDGARVAHELGIEVSELRQLMDDKRIAVLCERGTGEDEGTWRASFYLGKKRARFMFDRAGRVLAD
ncbi:DUF6522 family protein [Lysobacter panacisoli]|uniref:DNA-binding protein n=1 Tax=Lysobacter panacisoli TaxID=1255263 RepID=A0ABP9L0R5_9GAMM|nr:DUF6522 family protein [Lysobacter panacisoli]